jgi:beta-phosphoglucomutase-like phosphatase (HAD superfamily)
VTTLAVLVDLDGTLVDTAGAWRTAYARLADELGSELPAELWARIAGQSMRGSLRELGPAAEQDPDAAVARLTELASAVPLGADAWLPGAAHLLRTLADHGVPHAVVTSSQRPFALHALASPQASDLPPLRDVGPPPLLVCGGETPRAKPHPDPYLHAAALLAVDPRACLVIEDSPNGVAAAEAAGMAVLAVPHEPAHRTALPAAPGRAHRDDLVGLDVAMLAALHARLRSELDSATRTT